MKNCIFNYKNYTKFIFFFIEKKKYIFREKFGKEFLKDMDVWML